MIMHGCCNTDAKRIFHKTNNPVESLRELPRRFSGLLIGYVYPKSSGGKPNENAGQSHVFFDRLLH